ncbi:D-3-phosphoglycerate dehydrogenase 2, chloroplastic-like protein, partial [Drosera capensis]
TIESAPITSQDPVPFVSPRPSILVLEKLGEAGIEVLRQFADVDCSYDPSPDDLCERISRCDAFIVRSAGVGIDNVDLVAATEFGCLVVNAPTANKVAAAEHGVALMAAMARNVAQADASMKAVLHAQSAFGILFTLERTEHIDYD